LATYKSTKVICRIRLFTTDWQYFHPKWQSSCHRHSWKSI